MSAWICMNIKGQGHSLTLVQGRSDSTFSQFFSLETAKPIKAKYHAEPPWDVGTKVCSNGPGHLTNMAVMLIYSKKLKKSSSLAPKADDLETWYATSGTRILPSFFKWWPWVDLGLFYGKIKFGSLCFCMGKKGKTMDFSETIVVYDVKVGRCS